MRARLTPCAVSLLAPALQVLAAEPFWHDKAWVRKYSCDQSRADASSLEFDPFWIDSFRGAWVARDGTSKLELGILAVHNESLFNCEDIDISAFKSTLDFKVLGRSVGQMEEFRGECPLPITDTLTPLGKEQFSAYYLTYAFPSAHRLQTLTSTFRLHRPNGTQLDCGVLKMTPDLGKPVSVALTITPIGVLFFAVISSWRTHLSGLDFSPVLEHGFVFAGQGPLWAMVRELTSYLRHLQFISISASMSIEYPGFYVPAVSKIAWSCLLFWRGPVDHGYSHSGINSGMYISNASYGMQFMSQMLGYPDAIDMLANSLINLTILVVPTFLLLALFFLKVRQTKQVGRVGCRSITKLTAGITSGITLCFFSVPLLSYMAYDLVLVGYLPSYRIVLAVAMLITLVGAHSFLARQVNSELHYKPMSTLDNLAYERVDNYYGRLWEAIYVQLSHLVPLLQGVAVGGLQDHPHAQVSILATTELMVPIQTAYKGTFATTETLFSVVRFISALLCTVLVSTASESMRQRVGYAMLALHGLVVLAGWPLRSGWQLYRTFQNKADISQAALSTGYDESSDLSSTFRSNDLSSHPPSQTGHFHQDYRQDMLWQHQAQSTLSFYRNPRSRTVTPVQHGSQPSLSSTPPIELAPIPPVGETNFDIKLALSQISPRADVDYSVREVDRYYGLSPQVADVAMTLDLSPSMEQNQTSEVGFMSKWKHSLSFNHPWFHKKKQEQGFQVMRPPRLQLPGAGTTGYDRTLTVQSQSGRVHD